MFDIKDISQLLIANPDGFMQTIEMEPQKFSPEFAEYLDSKDPLKYLKESFDMGETIPFAGHSLGPAFLPGKAEILKIYDLQRDKLHAGHFSETINEGGNWFDCDIDLEAIEAMQKMLGFVDPVEFVFSQAGLSANLGNLLDTFYRPTAEDWETNRTKICHLSTEFFSDQAVVHSILERNIETARNFRVIDRDAMLNAESLTLKLEPNEFGIFNSDDIIATVKKHAHEIQVLHLSDLVFSTGQRLDIAYILSELKEIIIQNNIRVGLDLAHTAGNRTLNLNELQVVTYAVGCDYKHCGGTAGSGFGFYVNKNADLKKYKPIQGWKAADSSQVFAHINGFKSDIMQTEGAWAFRMSNASPVGLAPIKTFIKQMSAIGWNKIEAKSESLTRYLHAILIAKLGDKIQFITPVDAKHRGAMLVFRVNGISDVEKIESELKKQSAFGAFEIDVRKPNNIRVTPHYGYTSFTDIQRLVSRLQQVIAFTLRSEQKASNVEIVNKVGLFSVDLNIAPVPDPTDTNSYSSVTPEGV